MSKPALPGERIGRQRARDVDPGRARGCGGGGEDIDLLAAEGAVLPGVRVETRQSDARGAAEMSPPFRNRAGQSVNQPRHGERIPDLAQREVGGVQRHLELPGEKTHQHRRTAGLVLEIFGVAAEIREMVAHRGLAQRRGDEQVGVAPLYGFQRRRQAAQRNNAVGGGGGGLVNSAAGNVLDRERRRERDGDARRLRAEMVEIAEQPEVGGHP